MFQAEVSKQCHVCEVFTGHEIYPCRICSKAFHKSCLQKLSRCTEPQDIALLHSAKSPTGWTCYICVSSVVVFPLSESTFNSQPLLAHLSRRLIGELIGYSWSGVRPSVRRTSSSSTFQTSSSPKPHGRSKPNFMWSLLG